MGQVALQTRCENLRSSKTIAIGSYLINTVRKEVTPTERRRPLHLGPLQICWTMADGAERQPLSRDQLLGNGYSPRGAGLLAATAPGPF